MNGFRVMGRVLASGTVQTVRRWFWWQAARNLTGRERFGQVSMRVVGALCLGGFGVGFLWALGALWYVLAAGWFVCIGVFAEVPVEDTEPLPSPTEEGWGSEETAGQELVVEKGRIGKARVLRIPDPSNPHHTHLVWLDQQPKTKGA